MLGGHRPGTLYKSLHIILTAVITITILSTENQRPDSKISILSQPQPTVQIARICPGYTLLSLQPRWKMGQEKARMPACTGCSCPGQWSSSCPLCPVTHLIFPYKLIYKLQTDDQVTLILFSKNFPGKYKYFEL